MSKKTWFLIVGALLLLQASSCRPEPEPQKYLGTYPLGDIKDYLYFKPGSMWVYECDSTGELDTQIMVSCDTPWLKESYIQYQELDRVVQSKNEGSNYNDTRIKAGIPYSDVFNYYFYLTRWRWNPKTNGTGTDCIFFYPFDTNSNGGYGSSPTYYKGLLTNYTVLGNTYDTVRVFQVQAGGTFPKCKIASWNIGTLKYYWAKNVGIIKISVNTAYDGLQVPCNFNWNLKSFKVSQ